MTESRSVLSGLIHVPMWNYWWGLSENQIDLLLVDQPLVVYPRNKDGKKKGNGRGCELPPPSKKKIAEAEMKWKQKYGNGQKPKLDFSTNDFKIGSIGK